jgi:F0F1-type ATP synthase assembly protein I
MDTNSFRDREEKRQSSFKVMYDFAAGILWLGAGVFFLAGKYLGGKLIVDSLLSTIFGIACVCYGVFRLYRGFYATRKR